MDAIGLLMILSGVMLGRQVVTGRVMETGTDFRDITVAVFRGDMAGLKSTLSQRGSNVPVDSSMVAGESTGTGIQEMLSLGSTDLVTEMVQLGSAAKGYSETYRSGPNYYDCSGLVWAALHNLGVYNGPVFTTHTFLSAMGGRVMQVNSPVVGSIVLWPNHMGVVTGPDQMYSAMSPSAGIKYGSISGSNKYFGVDGKYYVLTNAPATKTPPGGVLGMGNLIGKAPM